MRHPSVATLNTVTHTPPPDARAAADAAQREEESLRERWEATEQSLRQRFDVPISRATRLTEATLAWFPVRVWRHFLIENGFLLAAGVSYVALFACFAAIYLVFAIVGFWLGGSTQAVNALIDLINVYIPGLIAESGGLATPEQVQQIASSNSGVLGWTGLIALGTLIWTAIDWVTYSRRAVRELFAIPPDRRSYFLLKARDFVAALVFGAALVLGAALSVVGSYAVEWMLSLIGLKNASAFTEITVSIGSVFIGFVITSTALVGLFRFLTGTKLPWRLIWPGAMLGASASRSCSSARACCSVTPRPTRCWRPSRSSSACCCGSGCWASSCSSRRHGSRWRRRTATSCCCRPPRPSASPPSMRPS